jgi:hypothetical protein
MGRGYTIPHSFDNVEPAIKGPRLKGKARTLARASHQATDVHEKLIARAYHIEINDFICLAEFISKVNKPRVKVPQSFVLQLRQAIKTRKSHHRVREQMWREPRVSGFRLRARTFHTNSGVGDGDIAPHYAKVHTWSQGVRH